MRGSFRRSGVSRIGGFIKSTLQDLGVEERILEQRAMAKWKDAVGPQIAASSRAESVREGVLFVCCKSSMWSSELTLHKNDIVAKLNASVGKQIIKDVRFSARGFRKEEEKAREKKSSPLESIPIDPEEARTAQETAAVCDSDELSGKVMRAIITSKRLRELKLQEGYKPCRKCGELHNGKHEVCDSCRTMV